MRWKATLGSFIALIGVFLSLEAQSAPDTGLEAISDAYAPYRISLSYLRAGETELGEILLQQFTEKWQQASKILSADPPAPFDKDPQFAASLADILKMANDGEANLARGDTGKAIVALEPIRTIMAGIRRRNGIRTLSDCIDDISDRVSTLQKLRDAGLDLIDPAQSKQVSDVIVGLAPILDHCSQQPPAQNREQFDRLIQQAKSSINTGNEALANRDTGRFLRIFSELRSIDHILFQEFD